MRMLVAYAARSTHVATTRDYLEAFARHSTFDVRYLNVALDSPVSPSVDLDAFDVVFQSYCARLAIPGYVDERFLDKLRRFQGVKLLSVQDEYENTDRLRRMMLDIGYDVVFTCVPTEYIERIYPREMFPTRTEFINVLTGYAPDRTFAVSPIRERPIHVGYRGRELFMSRYGRLAFEKVEIGRRMKVECEARIIPHDIAWDERSRIYGDAWFNWLRRCRSVLGTESGSNIFQLDSPVSSREAGTTQSVSDLSPFLDMAQISPRVFEAAATHTPMILFEGRYSGIIEPWTHYIPLAKDFSNIDAVFIALEDHPMFLENMAQRAYDDLIKLGQYSYAEFVRTVEAAVSNRTKSCGRGAHGLDDPSFTSLPQGITHAHYLRLMSNVRPDKRGVH